MNIPPPPSTPVDIERVLYEHKYRYYVLDKPIITDHEYDRIERPYLNRCMRKGVEPFGGHNVGFSYDHPMAKAIIKKLGGKKKERTKDTGLKCCHCNHTKYSPEPHEVTIPVWYRLGPPGTKLTMILCNTCFITHVYSRPDGHLFWRGVAAALTTAKEATQ